MQVPRNGNIGSTLKEGDPWSRKTLKMALKEGLEDLTSLSEVDPPCNFC